MQIQSERSEGIAARGSHPAGLLGIWNEVTEAESIKVAAQCQKRLAVAITFIDDPGERGTGVNNVGWPKYRLTCPELSSIGKWLNRLRPSEQFEDETEKVHKRQREQKCLTFR